MQTKRDTDIVDWIGRLGAAGAEHVMRRFGVGRRWTYSWLNRLVAEGLLERRNVTYGQAGIYVASEQGLLRCGLSRLEVHRVTQAGLVHDREVASVAVEFHAALRGRWVISERELSIGGGAEGTLDRFGEDRATLRGRARPSLA